MEVKNLTDLTKQEIIVDIKEILATMRTCKKNISTHCVETGPEILFRSRTTCLYCARHRSCEYMRMYHAKLKKLMKEKSAISKPRFARGKNTPQMISLNPTSTTLHFE